MELIGKIVQVCPIEQGTSKAGKPWKKLVCVLETQESFPKKVAFTIFGEEKVAQYEQMVQVGSNIRLFFDINSRDFNGRWYTDISAWKIEPADAQVAGQQTVQQQPQYQQTYPQSGSPVPPPPSIAPQGPEDDLPF